MGGGGRVFVLKSFSCNAEGAESTVVQEEEEEEEAEEEKEEEEEEDDWRRMKREEDYNRLSTSLLRGGRNAPSRSTGAVGG